MFKMTSAIAALVLTLTAAMSTNAGVLEKEQAQVYVIHGIPGPDGFPVDVKVADAICLLEGFTYGEVEGPFSVDPGVLNVEVSVANPADPCANAPALEADIEFAPGEVATIIAYLTEDGTPTAAKFVNNVSTTPPGRARLVAYHTAAVSPVDITLRRGLSGPAIVVPNVANGDEVMAPLRPGGWNISLSPVMSDATVGPVRYKLRSGFAYFVYAVGSLDDGSFMLINNVIDTRN